MSIIWTKAKFWCCDPAQTWIAEMAAFVKSIAPMQLLGLGDEGFATSLNDQDPSTLVAANPGATRRRL